MEPHLQEEKYFKGIAGAPGVVHGPLFSFYQGEVEVPRYSVPPERREEEIARFEQGLMETRRQISAIRAEVEEKVGEEEASIFDAHQLVLEDRALIEDTVREVGETGFNIEYCFQEVANRYIEAFNQIDDEYIKERVSDIRDVSKRLICNLLGHDHRTHGNLGIGRHILISADLSPSETALLDVKEVIGIATEQGSKTSHSVIMARSLNIPCVVGVRGLLDEADFGSQILIDGYKGHVYLNPGPETLERYGRLASEQRHVQEVIEAERLLPCETLDKFEYHLLLNVEGVENKEMMHNSGAMGVGLFRTENIFLAAEVFPGEEEQFEVYKELVQSMGGAHPVTIRTLDLGGDKNPHKSLTGYQEANPFMGFRGIRFCLEHTDVFKDQLRAILRASHYGKIKVLYPMICSLDELRQSNQLLEEAKQELAAKGIPFDENIQKGAMIEVPSAAVITDMMADHCDFFSIGTNDLMQYLLAVDRINDRIAYLYEASQPAVIRTLNFIFQQGKMKKVPVSVCGELAADPHWAPLLIGLGASDLSVSMGSIANIKYLIRRMRLHDAKHLAIRVLRCNETHEIQQELIAYYDKVMGETVKGLKEF
jgi:phosphotransferase system enzyme I (PtsI)